MISARVGPARPSQAAPPTTLILIALFLFGAAINLFYGRRGFMPLDQGIVFDGAWRLLSGQVPFKDFAAPNGLVPAVMQVPFFQTLGVTWFAFCLHAAVINGAFCVLAFLILRSCEATRAEAAFYAAASALYFYPPTGTPFMDQHAFFFVTLMLVAVVGGTRSPSPAREKIWWLFVPIFFVLGFLSKQIPTAFAAVAVALWVAVNPSRARVWIRAMALGTVVALLALGLLAWAFHADPIEAFRYLVIMPLGVGAERTTGRSLLAPARLVLGTMRRLPGWSHQWAMYVPAAAVVVLLAGSLFLRDREDRSRWRLYLWLLLTLCFITGAFVAYTVNQIEDGFPLVMLAVGLSAVCLRGFVNRIFPGEFGMPLAAAVAVVVGIVAVRDTAVFAASVDATRSVLDTNYDPSLADQAAPLLPPELRFLRWTHINCEPGEFADLVRFLRRTDRNFAVISDLAPLYALTGKPSVGRALWLHPGLTMPESGTPAFARFEDDFLARLGAFNVRWLVLDEPHTLRDVSLGDFPRLRTMVLARDCGERYFGQVRVIDLCTP